MNAQRQIHRQSGRVRDKDRRSAEEHESERDVEMNAFFYPPRSTTLKPFHNFLFPFCSKLGYIQNMCICLHARLICICCGPLQECACSPEGLCVCVIEQGREGGSDSVMGRQRGAPKGRCGGREQPEQAGRHTCCDVRKRINRSAAWLQSPTHLRQTDRECVRGYDLSWCAFECVGEVYYVVLECSFCDEVLKTGLYSTCTHLSAEGEWKINVWKRGNNICRCLCVGVVPMLLYVWMTTKIHISLISDLSVQKASSTVFLLFHQ